MSISLVSALIWVVRFVLFGFEFDWPRGREPGERVWGGDQAAGPLPPQRGPQTLGDPGVVPPELRDDHEVPAAEADSAPEIPGPGAPRQDPDLTADRTAGGWAGLGLLAALARLS